MAKLTIKMLKDAGACAPELERLKGLFGSSVEITEEFCVKHASECNWGWASKLLSPEARAEYERVRASAWAEYDRARAPARVEYERVTDVEHAECELVSASAWAEYERARASAWAEYEHARAPARAGYDRVSASAWAEYGRARASAWARLWIQDHPTCKA